MPRCPSRHPPPQIRSYTPPKPYSLPPTFALPLPPTSPQRVARGARTSSSIPDNPAAVLKARLCLRLDEHLGLGARRANTAGANGSYGTRRAVSNVKHATNGVAESDFDELLGWEKELRSPALKPLPASDKENTCLYRPVGPTCADEKCDGGIASQNPASNKPPRIRRKATILCVSL
ncbi:hypothetical protein B0H14DRAFT_2795420 [Mycena olivaceomarginata]|nr:hypothetical protein B0H14DRAFT_2795420 [Mycena olivaceomarginata]